MPARKKAKVADTRLPHANDIEFLAAFRGYVEVTELKSQSDKFYRAEKAEEAYARHLDLIMHGTD